MNLQKKSKITEREVLRRVENVHITRFPDKPAGIILLLKKYI